MTSEELEKFNSWHGEMAIKLAKKLADIVEPRKMASFVHSHEKEIYEMWKKENK